MRVVPAEVRSLSPISYTFKQNFSTFNPSMLKGLWWKIIQVMILLNGGNRSKKVSMLCQVNEPGGFIAFLGDTNSRKFDPPCFSQRTAKVTGSGPSWFRSCCNIFMNCSSMWSRPQPHRHDISARLKLGVIMSTMTAPTARMNVLRRIDQRHQSFPSASSFERI